MKEMELANPLPRSEQLFAVREVGWSATLWQDFDWVTLSPKKFKPAEAEYFSLAHELKVIVFNRHDLKWAEEQAARCDHDRTLLYLQPEWSKREQVHEIIAYIKDHPWWKLGLQTHKYVNIP